MTAHIQGRVWDAGQAAFPAASGSGNATGAVQRITSAAATLLALSQGTPAGRWLARSLGSTLFIHGIWPAVRIGDLTSHRAQCSFLQQTFPHYPSSCLRVIPCALLSCSSAGAQAGIATDRRNAQHLQKTLQHPVMW